MTKQHYALIEKQGCNPLEISFQEEPTNATIGKPSRQKRSAAGSSCSTTFVREELEDIYQTYADIYPNPKLLEEKRQRDTLLQAARAASHYQQETKSAKETTSRRGFFTFLFGTREDPDRKASTQKTANDNSNNRELKDDDPIRYVDLPNEYDDGSLCGTLQSLDVSCIPPEVYKVARFHLTSTRTRRDNLNALRWGPGGRMLTQQPSNSNSTCSVIFIVVGLGEIAEFGDASSSSRILQTSDRNDLLGYAQRSQQFDLSSVRGTIISQNCLAVSWGFLDGITVFYRRRISLSNDNQTATEGWEAVWWLGPSMPVLDNLTDDGQDLFFDDTELPGSPLLKISDCLALHTEAPMTSRDEEPTTTVATLVVSRLGGFIELVPLPIPLWKGPIIERKTSSSPRNRGRRQQHSHYAAGKNIECPPNALALTTCDYHLDVQSLEVYRTNVNSETIWNKEEYPDGPPADFLLVASGVSVDGEYGEAMTFWGISTVFESSNDEELMPDFSVHSRLLEAIWTSTGAPVSTFATPGIMSQWRTPRQVELKDSISTNETTEDHQEGNPSPTPLAPVTTLSTAAPIVAMKFSDRDKFSSERTGGAGPFLSVLDWNGGVQIFDCSSISRLAAQTLTQHEYEQYRGVHNDGEQGRPQMDFHLVKCVMLRSQIGSMLQKFSRIPVVTNLHWLESTGLGTDEVLPSIVFILSRSKMLVVATLDLPEDNAEPNHLHEPLNSSIVSVPFPVSSATIESFTDNCLSFVSLRIGSSKSTPKTTTQLFKFFVMEQLQPVAIVETLARESKFKEAIQSASKLSKNEQDELAEVVVSCHRSLWETKRDIDSLIATNDELYILGEVESICGSERNEFGFSLDDLRTLLKLSLDIVSNHRGKEERVRKAFVGLGTFELLCRYYDSKPSWNRFQKEFLQISMIDLSMELARRGDVPALSIVLYRHRFEVREKLLAILGALPLAMKSSSFCHLLPVVRNETFADLFLDSINEDISELPWSHMPQYILEKYQVSIAFDRSDEMVVLEYNNCLNDQVKESEQSAKLVVDWFVKRAKNMQTFVGNVDDVVNFTEVGIRCSSMSVDEINIGTGISSVQELQMTGRTALSLKRMLLDQTVLVDGDGIDTDDLMGMDLVEILDFVLDCGAQSSIIRYRFDEYIQPLAMEMSISNSSDHLDESLAAFCLKKAQKFVDGNPAEAKYALQSATAIAETSKSSLPKKDRLIKNKNILIGMVFDVIDEILKNIATVEISMNDGREIIESFWSLYETLPAYLAPSESEIEQKLQRLHDDLVCFDILSRWPGCNAFSFFNILQSERHNEEHTFQGENCHVLEICELFYSSLTVIASSQDQVSLLQDLLCDVQILNEIGIWEPVDLAVVLSKSLTPTFLKKGYFGLVASYLESGEKIVDRKQVLHNVIEYVDEAMFSDGDSMNRINDAIQCQEALEPFLPELQSLFQSNRRYLDGSHFISTVLLEGKVAVPLKPSDLKEMNALDVVETILQEFPECIACRCSQWMNNEYAQDANRLLRLADTSASVTNGGGQNNELPDLPGGAIFHLATILGLESNTSALAVKSRVIHYALQGGYYGAAAAIARTLLQSQDGESGANTALDTIKLGVIAEVVSIEDYGDLCTKKELCETVLRRFDRKMCIDNAESFNIILQVSSKLDYITSRFDQEVNILSPERRECLLSRPIARLHHHTIQEYSKDMHFLLKDLSNQSREGLVHDSLMDVLSRFIFYWCIHDSITTRSVIDLRYKADTEENLKLGCALLLQIPSILTAEESVRELQEIALTQAGIVGAEERFEASNIFILPNPDILRHLIQRGFTENAARRAATMTGNAGQNEAMAWAVQHAMDPNLNDPLIMLKSPSSKMIDEDSIQLLHKSLIQLSDIIENPSSRSVFLHNLTHKCGVKTKPNSNTAKVKNTRQNASKTRSQKPPKRTETNGLKPSMKNDSSEENGTMRPDLATMEYKCEVKQIARKQPPPPPPKSQKPPKKIETNGLKPSGKNNSSEENGTTSPDLASLEQKSEVEQIARPQRRAPPPPPPRRTVTKSTGVGTKDSTISAKSKTHTDGSSIGNGATTKAHIGIKGKAKPEIDREELKKRGQAALMKLKRGRNGTLKESTKIAEEVDIDKKEPRKKGLVLDRSKTKMDREELRKRGKAALSKLRIPQSEPESRRRLIEEGRQLLKQSQDSSPKHILATDRTKSSARSRQFARSEKSTSSKPTAPPIPKTREVPLPPPRPNPPSVKGDSLGKVVKIDSDESKDDDAGWDFDDFDNF